MHAGCDDTLADWQTYDIFAECVDHASCFAAADCGEFGLVAVVATHGPQVMVVHRRTSHRDAHLALAWLGRGLLAESKHLGGVAELGVEGCAHGNLLPSARSAKRPLIVKSSAMPLGGLQEADETNETVV